MEATVEIRYDTLRDVANRMPLSQLEKFVADLRRLFETRLAANPEAPVRYRKEIVDAARRLEAGEGIEMTGEQLHELIMHTSPQSHP